MQILILLALFLIEAWFFSEPGWEPAVTFIITLSGYVYQYEKDFNNKVNSITLDSGIDMIFENEEKASADILSKCNKSEKISILSIRGNRITSEERKLSEIFNNKLLKKEIFISKANSKYLEIRANDFDRKGNTYINASYINEVKLSIQKLKNIASNPLNNTELYLHSLPETFRLFFTKEYLYLSFFNKGESASKSRVFRIKKDTELFNAFSIYLDWIKNDLSKKYT